MIFSSLQRLIGLPLCGVPLHFHCCYTPFSLWQKTNDLELYVLSKVLYSTLLCILLSIPLYIASSRSG